jgi:hypothetical protein
MYVKILGVAMDAGLRFKQYIARAATKGLFDGKVAGIVVFYSASWRRHIVGPPFLKPALQF